MDGRDSNSPKRAYCLSSPDSLTVQVDLLSDYIEFASVSSHKSSWTIVPQSRTYFGGEESWCDFSRA